MQARLSLIRVPSFLVAVVFTLAAALILGGVVGYTMKPPTVIPGRTQVIVLHDAGGASAADPCIWVNHKKAC